MGRIHDINGKRGKGKKSSNIAHVLIGRMEEGGGKKGPPS